MNKSEAVHKWVEGFNSISQSWIQCVLEHIDGEYQSLPMWGTMFVVDDFDGEKFMANSRVMVYNKDELFADEIEGEEEQKAFQARLNDENDYMEDYTDEEMSGQRCILDKDGDPTAAFLYEVDGSYVVGVNGAGWNFYDGVWDRLYDVAGLHWHTEGYVVFNPKNHSYWNNDNGWTDKSEATVFNREEKESLHLPIDGEWREQ